MLTRNTTRPPVILRGAKRSRRIHASASVAHGGDPATSRRMTGREFLRERRAPTGAWDARKKHNPPAVILRGAKRSRRIHARARAAHGGDPATSRRMTSGELAGRRRAARESDHRRRRQRHRPRTADAGQRMGGGFERLSRLAGDHFRGGSTDLPSAGFGRSPMTVFRGQTENAGHFAQPTASAMGQSVMTAPSAVKS